MPIVAIRNSLSDYVSRRLQEESRTVITLIGVGRLASATVRQVHESGTAMVDNFLYLEGGTLPTVNVGLTSRYLSVADAAQGANLAIVVAKADKAEESQVSALVARQLQSPGRLVIEVRMSTVAETVLLEPVDSLSGGLTKNSVTSDHIISIKAPLAGLLADSSLSGAGIDNPAVRCIRALTEILNDGLVAIDFEDLRSTVQKASIYKVGWGRANGREKGTVAAMRALAHPSLESLFSSATVDALVVTVEASRQTAKMRDYKLVMDALTTMLRRNAGQAKILCGVVNRDVLPADTIDVTLIAGIALPCHP